MVVTSSIALFQKSSLSCGLIACSSQLFSLYVERLVGVISSRLTSYLSPVTCHLLLLRGVLDVFKDLLIAGAATEIAFQPMTDLFARRVCIAVKELACRHDHSGR